MAAEQVGYDVSSVKQFKCFLCTKAFSILANAVFHVKYAHFIKQQLGNPQLKCIGNPNCPKAFDKFKSWQDHSRICHVQPLLGIHDEEELQILEDLDNVNNNNVMEILNLSMFSPNELEEHNFEDEPGEYQEPNVDRRNPNEIESIHLSNRAVLEIFLTTLLEHKISKTLLIVIFTGVEVLLRSLQELLIKFLSKQIVDFETSECAELIAMYFSNVI